MPSNQNLNLVDANRSQRVSETDSFTPARYRQMRSHFPNHARKILDAGCNTGRGGLALKALNPAYELTGLDCVPERVSVLDKAVYSQTICGFSNEIPVGNNSFDVIVGGEFIEHVPPSQIDATLAEFFRVLRLKGRLLLTTPNPNYLKNKLKNLSVLSDESHLTQHFPDALAHRMHLTGFSRIKVCGSGRVSSYLGQHFPWLSIYGSYLIQGDKW